jgi:hypothetical protein
MILGCVLIGVATLVLPRLGVQISGGLFFAFVMLLCCAAPMLFMARASDDGSGCCDKGAEKRGMKDKEATEPDNRPGASCH